AGVLLAGDLDRSFARDLRAAVDPAAALGHPRSDAPASSKLGDLDLIFGASDLAGGCASEDHRSVAPGERDQEDDRETMERKRFIVGGACRIKRDLSRRFSVFIEMAAQVIDEAR